MTRPISSSLREVSTWRFREQIARSKKTPALQAIHDTDWLKKKKKSNFTFSPAASGSEERRTTARGVIRNDDFYRNKAQHCFEWLRCWFNLH